MMARTATTPATTRAAFSFRGFGNDRRARTTIDASRVRRRFRSFRVSFAVVSARSATRGRTAEPEYPHASAMSVVMYVKPGCPYCQAAREHLAAEGEQVEERDANH